VFFCVCKCCPLQQLAKPVRNTRCDTHSTPNISLSWTLIFPRPPTPLRTCTAAVGLIPSLLPVLAKLWPSSTPFATAIPPRQVMLLVAGHALLAVLCCSTLCRCLPCCLLLACYGHAMCCCVPLAFAATLRCAAVLLAGLLLLPLHAHRAALVQAPPLLARAPPFGAATSSSERCFILELPPLPLP
jgi:hypothetical protein